MQHTKTTIAAGALALLLVGLAMPASANHGLNGNLAGTLDDGTVVTAKLAYSTGNFDTQYWQFDWTVGLESFLCLGFGSIEVGFTSYNCAVAWSTGPTGDSHTYPNSQPDIHEVNVTMAGSGGSALQVLLPD